MKKQLKNKARYLGLKLTAIVFALLLITSGSVWAATETLNCPAGTIVNSTMTFNTTNFTIVHSKAADANFASYTPWRVYTNNTVSITGGSGVSSITSIVIYTSSSAYANAVNGSLTVTGGGSASASVSGNNCTITITGTATALLIDPSAQTRWSQIDINYSAASSCTALGTPTVTPTAGNTQATLSWDAVTNASSYTLIWNGGSAETVTSPVTKTGLINGTSYSYSVMAVGNGTTYCATNTAATGNVTPVAPSYTITPNSNNNSFGTVSLSGSIITGAPVAGYTYASPAYTVTSGTATVSQNANEFTVTPSSNCNIQINFEAIPTYTVTFNKGSGDCATVSLTESYGGIGVTLPSATPPTTCTSLNWVFAGWATASQSESTTSPTLYNAGATYNPASNITLYAVYKVTMGGGSVETTSETSFSSPNAAWTVNESAGTTYWKILQNNYILSPEIDLSTLTKVEIQMGTFGGTTGDVLSVTKDGTADVWATKQALNNTQSTLYTITETTALSGIGKLKFLSAGATSSIGLRVLSVKITYNVGASTTTYNSNPSCSNPSILVSETTLSGFSTTTGTASASQTFTVGGSNLLADLVVTAPSDYEVRENGVGSFGASVSFVPTSGTVATKTIEVRIASSAAVGSPSGNVVCSSTNATSQNVAVSGTVNAASTPVITLAGTINAFANTVINTTSAEQSYTVEGSNLTDNISIAPPTGFEISTATGVSFSATNPIVLNQSGGTVNQTTIYVRFAPTSVQAFSGNITHTSTGATQADKALSGTGIKAEPTNHATTFGAVTGSPSYSAIIVSWTDATGSVVPDGYLIKGSSVGYGSITDPVDGTAEADGSLVKNIAQGTSGIYEFTGLSASTPYYFKIFPYTNSSSAINYKTDPTIPQATATTDVQPIPTYTWIGANNGSWATSTNWNPTRTTPSTTDIMQFNDATTKTITSVPTQTIGGLLVSNGTKITLNSSGAATTLAINNGVSGNDLTVESGCELNIAQITNNSAFIIAIATGATGSISGSMDFSSATASTPNQITAADASGLTFNSGAVFTQNTNSTSNVFGSGTSNSVVFASGSSFVQYAGSNPFQKTQPASVVVFQTGSLFKLKANSSPSLNGRTYANFEIDVTAFSQANMTGAAGVTMDNLILTNSTSVGMNLTGAMNIKGNIIINSGTLSFSPTSATNINLNGSSTQTISGTGTLTIGGNANFVVDNNVVADKNITFGGALTVNSGKSLTVNAGKQLTVTGNTTLNGTEECLVLKSDATGSASFTDNGTISGSGTAKVERYLTGNVFHQLGLPISNTIAAGSGAGQTGNVFLGCTLDSYNETNNTYTGYTATNSVSPNIGYVVNSGTSAKTLSFAGSLNTGDKTYSAISYSGTGTNDASKGYNMIPNPYPSAINGSINTWTKNNVNNSIWVWDQSSTSPELTGNYLTWNGSAGTLTGGIIPAMQAFFIQTNDASPSVTIPNSARTHSSQSYYKSTVTDELTLKVKGNNYSDAIIVTFTPNATNNFDNNFDVRKLYGLQAAPQLFSLCNSEKLSINGLAPITTSVAVPVGLQVGNNGNYVINADGVNTFSFCSSIILEDLKTNTTQNLLQNPVYNFTAATTDNANRFVLHFATSVGVNENGKTNTGIYAYDNNIYVNANEQIKQIAVYNTMGQLIETTNNVNGLQKISMNGHATGYYIVKVITDNNVYSEKVLVK